jgi:histidinol-phosphate aminotransferase
MFYLNKIVRRNILALKPYSSARDEFSGKEGVFLDANENPFGILNRYPDPHQKELKKKLSEVKAIPVENIFIGNGSDEVIDIVFRTFCNPGKDKALTFSPTYGMYEVSAGINDAELITISLNSSFQIDFNDLGKYLNDDNLKLIFVCSPNNPTANNISKVEQILENFKGIVILDEAYNDFSSNGSFLKNLEKYPNLIISQTFSKAWALAGARVGIAYASSEIISLFNKVKPPYNVSELNQKAAINALINIEEFETKKALILKQKNILEQELKSLDIIKKIYPSDANFFLVETSNADKIYNELVKQKVITRNRSSMVKNCIRITVGTPEENCKLVNALKNITL